MIGSNTCMKNEKSIRTEARVDKALNFPKDVSNFYALLCRTMIDEKASCPKAKDL